MKNKNKILIISPFIKPNLGGVESQIEKLTTQIIKKKLFPVVISYQPLTRKVKAKSYQKFITHEIYRQSWFGVGLFNKLESYFPLQFLYLFPGLFYRCLVYYTKHHQEIICIHAHGFVAASIAVILKLIHPKRIVLSTHAIYNFERRPILGFFIKIILSPFDKILAVSSPALEELERIGISTNKLQVHLNYVNTNIFKPIIIDKYTNDVLFVGRLITKKGIRVFLETAKKLPNVNFHIVGDGPEENHVIESAKKLKNIKYYGPLLFYKNTDTKKLVKLYNIADFLISPYLYDEGFSTVLLESLSCSTPVIITNRGSPPTFLDKNTYYLLPKYPTSAKLANLLTKIYKKQVKSLNSAFCREYAIKNFGIKNADITINSYFNENR